jgi:hypothetical protein
MRAIKIIIKEDDCYKTHLIDLSKVHDVICTYPKEEKDVAFVENREFAPISDKVGEKIEFAFDDDSINLEIDLEKTPAKFIVYDDYGDEVEKSDNLREVEDAILQTMSNDDETDFPPVPGTPPAEVNTPFEDI